MRFNSKKTTLALSVLGCLLTAASAQAQGTKIVPNVPSKITNMTIENADVDDTRKLGITISGEGKTCNYYLTLTNTDTNQEWPLPKISAFPAPDNISIEMPYTNYPHGNYKFTAKARPGDARPGQPCQGGGNYIAFKRTRTAIKIAGDVPKIVDVLIEPGKKMGGTDRYRNDELIKFNVVGTVENSETKDAANRCGWTAQLVDKGGVAKTIGTGYRFSVWQSSMALTGVATGEYTLMVKTTSADDGLAKQPCFGKVTKKVEVFGAPGVIKDFKIYAYGSTGGNIGGATYGYLVLTPNISGAACMYKVTRKINHGKATSSTLHVHKAGASDELPREEYPDDETFLDITVEGMSTNYFEGGSCEGSVHKSVTVYDDPSKPYIIK